MKDRLKEFEVSCPTCGQSFKKEFNTAVFSTSLERDAILRKDFAKAICPACGHEFIVNYRFVYTDDELKYMIINDPKFKDPGHRLALISSFKLLDKARKNEADKFSRLMTSNIADLREKIFILEAGLDDRVVELMKYILLESDELSLDHDDIEEFTYEGAGGFLIKTKNGDVMNLPFVREVYTRIEESYRDKFSDKPELVDRTWAFDFLKNVK